MFLLGFFFSFLLLSYSCNVLGAYNELNKVRLAEESNMLWQQKRGLLLVTLSGEESNGNSSSLCCVLPYCTPASSHSLLQPSPCPPCFAPLSPSSPCSVPMAMQEGPIPLGAPC